MVGLILILKKIQEWFAVLEMNLWVKSFIQFFKALWRIGDSVNWIIIGQKQPVSRMLAACEIMCVRIYGEIWINM